MPLTGWHSEDLLSGFLWVLYRIEVAQGSGIGVYRVIRLVFVFRLQGFRVVQALGLGVVRLFVMSSCCRVL